MPSPFPGMDPYDAGPYLREIRYGEDAVIPPLRADQAAWIARIVQAARS
jgi:hypothetical protein